MQSIIDFIKYNNAFPIILSVVILGTGAAFAASPELRQSVFTLPAIPPAPTLQNIDSSALLSLDLTTFDFAFRVDAITESADTYYVTYSYRTLEVIEGVWQEIRKTKRMDIPLAFLGKRDLRMYLSEQVNQVMDREIAYLGEAQTAAGDMTAPQSSLEYASLVGKPVQKVTATKARGDGRVSDIEEESSAEQVVADNMVTAMESGKTPVETILSKEEIRSIIVAAVADFLAIDTSMPEGAIEEVSEAEDSSTEVAGEEEQTPPYVSDDGTGETRPTP